MNKCQKGFTLVELLIAMAVGTIIMAAIYAMINLGQGTSGNVARRVLTQQDSRAVLDLMAREVSMASFNPNMTATIWGLNALKTSDNSICNTAPIPAPFVAARKGIQIAAADNILIAMDLNMDNQIGGNVTGAENEYIRYNFDATNNRITRAVSCETPPKEILGGTDSSTMIRNNAAAVPLFQYFDINGTELASPLTNTSIPLIRRVRINLVVDVENEEKRGLPKVSRRTYSTDVLVRNHAFSP